MDISNKFSKNYDVFHAFLVEDADYDGVLELPVIKTSDLIPEKIIAFSKAMSRAWTDFDCYVHFYEHDKNFERLWNNPRRISAYFAQICAWTNFRFKAGCSFSPKRPKRRFGDPRLFKKAEKLQRYNFT